MARKTRRITLTFFLVASIFLFAGFVSANTNVSNCSELKQALINSNDDITLTADIDCNGAVWQDWDTLTPLMAKQIETKKPTGNIGPLAASYTRQYTNHFFDGKGYIISNLFINKSSSTTNYNGFIPYATNVIIQDVMFRNITLQSGCSAGTIFGRANTNVTISQVAVENSYVEGNTWCSTSVGVGGFTGYMGTGGRISDSYFTGRVISRGIDTTNPNCKASGLVGEASASSTNGISINRSYSVAELKCLGGDPGYMNYAGGIIGYKGSYTYVSNSFTSSSLNVTNNDYTNHGSVFGYAAGVLPTNFANNIYFDINKSGTKQCRQIVSGSGNVTSCFGVNATGVNSTYFYNKSKAPMNTWNFTGIWKENTNNYPTLKQFDRLDKCGGTCTAGEVCNAFGKCIDSSIFFYTQFDTNTNITDSSLFLRNGSYISYSSLVAGKLNESYNFTGKDFLRYETNNFSDFNSSKTISLWIKPSSCVSSGSEIISANTANPGDNYFYLQLSPTWVQFMMNDIAINYMGNICDNQWHLLNAIYDSEKKNQILYVDGAEVGRNNLTVGSMAGGSYHLFIGAEDEEDYMYGQNLGAQPYNYFNGQIDEVKIYNRTLNSTEISNQYSGSGSKMSTIIEETPSTTPVYASPPVIEKKPQIIKKSVNKITPIQISLPIIQEDPTLKLIILNGKRKIGNVIVLN